MIGGFSTVISHNWGIWKINQHLEVQNSINNGSFLFTSKYSLIPFITFIILAPGFKFIEE